MRIVHLSRFDGGDGAANVAQRVHRGLLRLGHDSTMFVAQRRSESADPTVVPFQPPTDLPSRVRRRLRDLQINRSFAAYRNSRPPGYEAFSDDRSRHGSELLNQLPACDVLHIQQMYQFVDYQSFFTVFPHYLDHNESAFNHFPTNHNDIITLVVSPFLCVGGGLSFFTLCR